jgi:hypothetical protein
MQLTSVSLLSFIYPLLCLLSTKVLTLVLLYYLENPGWVTDQDWIESYRQDY